MAVGRTFRTYHDGFSFQGKLVPTGTDESTGVKSHSLSASFNAVFQSYQGAWHTLSATALVRRNKQRKRKGKTHIMNKSKMIVVLGLAAVLQCIGAPSGIAQELFPALLKVTCVSTNQNGEVVYSNMGNGDLIMQCAADEGLTNTEGLSLVFNLTADALQVVAGTNNAAVGTNHMIVGTNQFLICTPLTFTNIVSLSGTNTNKIELLASVFVETNKVANGTLAATERFHFGSTNELTSFSLIGRIQYATLASDTNSTSICRGVLLAGSGLTNEEEGENEEGEGGHGNHGNHGNGHNGNNNHGNGDHGHH